MTLFSSKCTDIDKNVFRTAQSTSVQYIDVFVLCILLLYLAIIRLRFFAIKRWGYVAFT